MDHAAALREIREWPARRSAPRWPTSGTARAGSDRARPLRSDIAFGTVEAAVLMHAEAGPARAPGPDLAEADDPPRERRSLSSSGRARGAGSTRDEADRATREPTPGLAIRERIDRRDFYRALAAAALAIGFPTTALPFAEKARRIAPLDPEVQLVFGCVAEGLAEEQLLRHESAAAPRATRRPSPCATRWPSTRACRRRGSASAGCSSSRDA